MIDVEKYLRNQPDLISFLAEIPEIKRYVERLVITEEGKSLVGKIPQDLIMNFYTDVGTKGALALHNYCKENLEEDDYGKIYSYLTLR